MSSKARRVGRGSNRNLLETLEPRLLLTVTLDPLASVSGSSITPPAAKSILVPLTAPTYSAIATDVYEAAGGFKTFTVTYTDDALVNAATVVGNNSLVTVTGPNGYSAAAVYKSSTGTGNAASLTVTYAIAAPGGTWNAADAGAYKITEKGGVVKDTLGHAGGAALVGTFYYSPTVCFDERYYLAMNPGVAAAVAKGEFTSGYQHFLLYGQEEGLACSPYFNEAFYLQLNPDVAAAVKKGTFKSGWQHFVEFGAKEGRVASEVFSEKEYLMMYPDVAAAVAKGEIGSGFEHFLLYGQFEKRSPSLSFNLANYEALYPNVVTAVDNQQAGLAQTVTEHFIIYGENEGLVATSLFSESYYLSTYPDVAAAVAAGTFRSGFQHFILFGAHEERNPSANFDAAYYLSKYPDVAAAVANGTFNSAYQHYIEFGKAEGRLAVPPPTADSVALSVTVNTTNHTWQVFAAITSPTSDTLGLAAIQISLNGTGNVSVTSADDQNTNLDLPFEFVVASDTTVGFDFLRSTGKLGQDITDAQAFTYNDTGGLLNILTGVGLSAQTQEGVTWAQPVLLANGTYTGSLGTLSVVGQAATTTLLPATLPTPTADGVAFSTFSPALVTNDTAIVGP